MSAIPTFEKRNSRSINVYQLENSKLVSVYHSKNRKGRHKNELLRLLENKSSHYCLIKSISNLTYFLCRSKSKQNKGPKSRFCRNCFQRIVEPNFKKHALFGESNAPLEIRTRIESPSVEFVSCEKTQKCPFVVYADLEAINVASTQIPRVKNRTREIERQYAASFGAVLIDSRSWFFNQNSSLVHFSFKRFCQLQEKALCSGSFPLFVLANGIAKQSFHREDCIAKLLDALRDWVLWCYNEKQAFRLLRISQQLRMLNVSTVSCCICGKDVERTARVIHHCHLSGALIGVAHSKCNLRARTTNFLPVFWHNLSRHDAHHIPKHLKLKVSEELSAIAKTDETFISFSVNMPVGSYTKKCGKTVKLFQTMRFLNSYQFVSHSLDNLAKTLKTGGFLLLKEFFSNVPDQHRKVSFPTFSLTVSQNLKSLYQILVTRKTASLVKLILLYKVINMHLRSTKNSVAQTWEITPTSI